MTAHPGQPDKATLVQTVKAVCSAFMGVRRLEEQGAAALAPAKVIVVGLVCAALFVTTLIVVVRLVTG